MHGFLKQFVKSANNVSIRSYMLAVVVFIAGAVAAMSSTPAMAVVCDQTRVVIRTQADMQQLTPAGCDEIQGTLTVRDSQLRNLSGLEHLTRIKGTLEIRDSSLLVDITALSGLKSVGFIKLYNLPVLRSINFPYITSVGSLDIDSVSSLENLSGFSSLRKVSGWFRLAGASRLTNLRGLENLWEIGHQLIIQDTQQLQSLDGLQGLNIIGQTVSWIILTNNESLTSLAAIDTAYIGPYDSTVFRPCTNCERYPQNSGRGVLIAKNNKAMSACEVERYAIAKEMTCDCENNGQDRRIPVYHLGRQTSNGLDVITNNAENIPPTQYYTNERATADWMASTPWWKWGPFETPGVPQFYLLPDDGGDNTFPLYMCHTQGHEYFWVDSDENCHGNESDGLLGFASRVPTGCTRKMRSMHHVPTRSHVLSNESTHRYYMAYRWGITGDLYVWTGPN